MSTDPDAPPLHEVVQRKICWPDPDATCLEGGCLYCNAHPFRDVDKIRRWASRAEVVTNRGNGAEVQPMKAFRYGLNHGWGNAEVRTVNRRIGRR